MKKAIITLLLLSGYTMSQHTDNTSTVVNGSAHLHNQTFINLTINGSGHLSEIQATNIVTNGSLHATNCTFTKATINGGTHLDNCTIKEQFTVKGGCDIKNSTMHDVSSHGGFNMKHSQITGTTIIHGGAHIIHGKIQENLTLYGGLKIQNTTIAGTTTVYGGTLATQCTINAFISAGTENELRQSTITGSVLIKKSNSGWSSSWSFLSWLLSLFGKETRQKLTLIDTQIQGDVQFEQENGLIVLKGTSRIDGNITNATIS